MPLAKDVNAIAARGVPAADVAATRRTLLALLHNLAVDEARPRSALRRVPSTRELGRLVNERRITSPPRPRIGIGDKRAAASGQTRMTQLSIVQGELVSPWPSNI